MVFQIILKNLHKNNGILAVIGEFVQKPKELYIGVWGSKTEGSP